MTERKFTDEEVIKALEHCGSSYAGDTHQRCNTCPLNEVSLKDGCFDKLLHDLSLDLINRQRAELKALKMDNEQLQSDIVNATMNLESVQHELDKARAEIESLTQNNISTKYPNRVLCSLGVIFTKSLEDYDKLIGDISAEAIKEFVERLKERHYFHASCVGNCYQMSGNDIDRLVKEMTEVKEQ